MSLIQNRTGGSLVYAAALHTYQTVFNDIQNADTVCAANAVQRLNQSYGIHFYAIHSGGNTLFEMNGNVSGRIGGLLGSNTQFQEAFLQIVGLVGRALQIQTFVAQMPKILILGIVGLTAYFQRDVMSLCVVDFLLARLNIPNTPRSDDLHIGSKCLDCQLKTNLIVAFTGTTVADSISAFLLGDLNQTLCDAGTCMGRTEQILFILSASLQTGPDVLFDVFLAQILDIQLGCAGFQSLFFQAVQLRTLTNVGGNGDDFTSLVVFLQPGNDDGCVQSTGVGKKNFLDFFFHDMPPKKYIFTIVTLYND